MSLSVPLALLGAERLARALLGGLAEQGEGFSGRAAVRQLFDGRRGNPAVLGQACAVDSASGVMGSVEVELQFSVTE